MPTIGDYIGRKFKLGLQISAEAEFFLEAFSAAEFRLYFVQGLAAHRARLYLCSATTLLSGIEASILVTLAQFNFYSTAHVLSNNLLATASHCGLPVNALAFPTETDFAKKLVSSAAKRRDVDIVRLRNDLCRGELDEFLVTKSDQKLGPFNPEELEGISATLVRLSFDWAKALGEFQRAEGLVDRGPIPAIELAHLNS